eukprot:151325-Chlamydomonas_euryale.AAC.9
MPSTHVCISGFTVRARVYREWTQCGSACMKRSDQFERSVGGVKRVKTPPGGMAPKEGGGAPMRETPGSQQLLFGATAWHALTCEAHSRWPTNAAHRRRILAKPARRKHSSRCGVGCIACVWMHLQLGTACEPGRAWGRGRACAANRLPA